MGTTFGSLGIVSNGSVSSSGINPRTNLSFCVVATNCISASASGFTFGLPAGFSASVASYSAGIAVFLLSGPFATGVSGNNTFNFSVSDSGVNISATYQWTSFVQPAITVGPLSGAALPIMYS
jgi:hypothetical protein